MRLNYNSKLKEHLEKNESRISEMEKKFADEMSKFNSTPKEIWKDARHSIRRKFLQSERIHESIEKVV